MSKNYSTYTLRVDIHEHDFDTVETDQNFWANGVYWREVVIKCNNCASIPDLMCK
jgi:hypothetical protein